MPTKRQSGKSEGVLRGGSEGGKRGGEREKGAPSRGQRLPKREQVGDGQPKTHPVK